MKRNWLVTLMVFAATLGVSGCRQQDAPQGAEQKTKTPAVWEYNAKNIFLSLGNPETLKAELNKEGEGGWELVSVTPLMPIESPYSGYPMALGIFKRAKR